MKGRISIGLLLLILFASMSAGQSAPTITSVNPASLPVGFSAATISVLGSNFLPGVYVSWNGFPLVTSIVGVGQLTATIPAALLGAPASISVAAVNPGGFVSNTLPFRVGSIVQIITTSLAFGRCRCALLRHAAGK